MVPSVTTSCMAIDWYDPMMAAQKLRRLPGMVWLDSAMTHDRLGRYSYLAADPFDLLRITPQTETDGAPLSGLSAMLARYPSATIPDAPPFQGGAIGYIGYEFGSRLEPTPRAQGAYTPPTDDACFGFYDVVLAWDHVRQQAFIFSSGWPETDPTRRRQRAKARQDFFLELLLAPDAALPPTAPPCLSWHSNFDRAGFMQAVTEIKEYILAGDIYQANIARAMIADWPVGADPFDSYLSLRSHNPAPFAAWLDFPGVQIASSSPERFVTVRNHQAETRPIKGTIRRSDIPAEDQHRADILSASEKDRAENIMIVDLLRNDFSRVCLPDSVQVPVLCGLESYAGLHHLVSVVTGTVAPDRRGFDLAPVRRGLDLVAACFPGGSITGAPKIRAMQIIADIEQTPRGVYCGGIGWIGFNGDLDLNIAIRTLVFRDNKLCFHAGGGITALSDPAAEFDEVLTKSDRIMRVFGGGA